MMNAQELIIDRDESGLVYLLWHDDDFVAHRTPVMAKQTDEGLLEVMIPTDVEQNVVVAKTRGFTHGFNDNNQDVPKWIRASSLTDRWVEFLSLAAAAYKRDIQYREKYPDEVIRTDESVDISKLEGLEKRQAVSMQKSYEERLFYYNRKAELDAQKESLIKQIAALMDAEAENEAALTEFNAREAQEFEANLPAEVPA